MPEGRLRTGDVAIIDEAGWIYLVDRLKDQINVSGYKVRPPRGRGPQRWKPSIRRH